MTYIPAKYMGAKRGNPTLVVIHDMEAPEGPLTAENCARYFQTIKKTASAHYCLDSDSTVQCVPDDRVAFAAPGANQFGLQLELAGYARQTKEQWSDPYSTAVIFRTAALTAEKCKAYRIPVTFRSVADLVGGRTSGITTHWNVTQAFRLSTHTDPGPGFPIGEFMQLVAAMSGGATPAPPPHASPPPAPDLAKLAPAADWARQQAVVRLGDKNLAVAQLQQFLNAIVGQQVLVVDGSFGPTTERWVKQYQKDRGLTADGVVGFLTWVHLCLDRLGAG